MKTDDIHGHWSQNDGSECHAVDDGEDEDSEERNTKQRHNVARIHQCFHVRPTTWCVEVSCWRGEHTSRSKNGQQEKKPEKGAEDNAENFHEGERKGIQQIYTQYMHK